MLLISFAVSLTGCWDYTEYEEMTQIYSLGIDLNRKSNEITLTLQYIPIVKSSGEKSMDINRGTVYSASGLTIVDALNKLQQVSPNKLFFGYLQVILISEDAAQCMMKDIIEYIERTPSIRNSVGIIIVPGSAEGTIATRDPNSVISSGKKIRMLLNSAKNNGNTYSVTLHDFLQMMTNEGIEAIAPGIITTPPIRDSGSALGGAQKDIRFAVEKQGNIMTNGVAAFKKDKFVGWLNDRETLGLNWILGNAINVYEASNTDGAAANDDMSKLPLNADVNKMLYFYITNSSSKIKITIEDNKPAVYLKVKVKAALRKYYSDAGNEYIDSSITDSIEEKLKRNIYADIAAAIKRGKMELGVDIFQFGFNFYRQHPREWHKNYEESWDKIFKNTPVNVNVEVKVINTGSNIKKFFIK